MARRFMLQTFIAEPPLPFKINVFIHFSIFKKQPELYRCGSAKILPGEKRLPDFFFFSRPQIVKLV